MPQIVSRDWLRKAQMLRQLYAHYQENKDLVSVGAYQAGTDPTLDLALNRIPMIQSFLQQELTECVKTDASLEQLNAILPDVPQADVGGQVKWVSKELSA